MAQPRAAPRQRKVRASGSLSRRRPEPTEPKPKEADNQFDVAHFPERPAPGPERPAPGVESGRRRPVHPMPLAPPSSGMPRSMPCQESATMPLQVPTPRHQGSHTSSRAKCRPLKLSTPALSLERDPDPELVRDEAYLQATGNVERRRRRPRHLPAPRRTTLGPVRRASPAVHAVASPSDPAPGHASPPPLARPARPTRRQPP